MRKSGRVLNKSALVVITGMCLVIFAMGILQIHQSTKRGLEKGNDAIWENGGSIETSKYNRIVEESIKNYRITGVIFAAVGGGGVLTVLKVIIEQEE